MAFSTNTAIPSTSNISSMKPESNDDDAITATIKMLEDDYYKFNEIVDKNLKFESDIEKQLEKEDRKCTFLKHTIASLKQKLEHKNTLRIEQSNYIFNLQMEIEKISSTIRDEMEMKRMAYPEEDAKPYREMVNVVEQMVNRLASFKPLIQQHIDDSMDRKVEIKCWENTSDELIRRILELRESKDRLRLEIDEIASFVNGQSPEDIIQSIENLQEIHREFENAKISHQEVIGEKNKLDLYKQQMIADSRKKKMALLSIEEKYERFEKSSADKMKILRTDINSVKQWYYDTMNEMKTKLDIVEKWLNEFDDMIRERLVVLEDINKEEITVQCKDETIVSNIAKLEDELTRQQELNETLEKQEEFAKDVYTSMQLHIDGIKTSVAENEIYVKNLEEELARLKIYSASLPESDESNDKPECTIQTDLENMKKENGKLEKELKKLKQEAADLGIAGNELKFKISACDAEIDFLNLLHDQISVSINEEKQKIDEEMSDKIEKCIENVTKLSNVVFEKNLLLDTVKADVQKCFKTIPQLGSDVKFESREIEDKKAKLSEIEGTLNKEEKNLESKVKLLEDLEKNTFPKNRIPAEWVQSLSQQKNVCEKLKAERLELEEKRTKLKKAEKDLVPERQDDAEFLEIYTDTQAKKQSQDLETKSAAYKIFKERIMKKQGAPLLG